MALIYWNDSFSVGNAGMDRQHRRLIDMLNGLHDAMLRDEGNSVLGELLAELIAFAQMHFAAEEKVLEKCGFPELPEHAEKHRALAAQVEAYAAQYSSGKTALSMQVLNFLRTWLQDHILVCDMDYREFNRQKAETAQRNLGDSGNAAPSLRGSEPPNLTPDPVDITA